MRYISHHYAIYLLFTSPMARCGHIKYRILRHQKTVHVILSVWTVYHRLRNPFISPSH